MTGYAIHPDRYNPSSQLVKDVIVVHTTETGEGDTSEQAVLRAMQAPGDRQQADGSIYGSSYHGLTDGEGGYHHATQGATAGTFSAPPLNYRGWHICMPGRANQTRAEWLDPLSLAHIKGVARFIVDHATHDAIPLIHLTPAELVAGERGFCGHIDVSLAWHKTNHTDPEGTLHQFPWDVLEAEIAAITNPAPIPVPVPPEDVDMLALDWKLNTADWTVFACNGTHLSWVCNGAANQVFNAGKVSRVAVTDVQLLALIDSTEQTTAAPPTLTDEMAAAWNG